MQSYRLSAAGRQHVLLSLVASLLIFAFALWMVRVALGPGNPGIGTIYTISQLLPVALLGILLITTPLVIWGILCEWAAVYALDDDGLHVATLGGQAFYPWRAIRGTRPHPNGRDTQLLVDPGATAAIGNPLLRWLFHQHIGRNVLRIPAELEHGDDLLGNLRARTAAVPGADTVAKN